MPLPRSATIPLVVVVVAIAIGPLMAGMTFGLFSLAVLAANGSLDFHNYAAWYTASSSQFILMIGLAYAIGWPVALSAGVLVAIWSVKRAITLWVVLGAASIAALGCSLMANADDIRSGDWDILSANLPVDFGFAIWAALLSWLVVRRPLSRE